MKTDTRENIYLYIESHSPTTVKDIEAHTGLSRVIIHKHLVRLIEGGKIYKKGTPPKVAYFPKVSTVGNPSMFGLTSGTDSFFEKHFVYVYPDGIVGTGFDAFVYWCQKRGMDPLEEATIYQNTWLKYDSFKRDGLIDGMGKMRDTFPTVYLDGLYYIDFYSIEKYWKTRLGNLLFLAKQNGDKAMISDILQEIRPVVNGLISKIHADSYAFIPPSIDRKVQFLSEIQKWLSLSPPRIPIEKIFHGVRIAQKSLSKTSERIENARETIYPMWESRGFKITLLIDDALGSWATMNETAKKLKERNYTERVIGLVIVGSANGFEVIKEV